MAEETGKKDAPAQTETKKKPVGLNVKLLPASPSDQPVLANYTTLNVAPGLLYIDFGFLEPGLLSALPRVARAGGKIPETINGRLAVRVAVGLDVMQNLHQQLGRVIAEMSAARTRSKEKLN